MSRFSTPFHSPLLKSLLYCSSDRSSLHPASTRLSKSSTLCVSDGESRAHCLVVQYVAYHLYLQFDDKEACSALLIDSRSWLDSVALESNTEICWKSRHTQDHHHSEQSTMCCISCMSLSSVRGIRLSLYFTAYIDPQTISRLSGHP